MYAAGDVRVIDVPEPELIEPTDAPGADHALLHLRIGSASLPLPCPTPRTDSRWVTRRWAWWPMSGRAFVVAGR